LSSVVHDTVRFLKEYASTPTRIGAVAPSSKALGSVMCDALDINHADTVIEFGPGTGALTAVIVDRLKPGARFITIEHNENFANILRERRPDVTIYHDTAENVRTICNRENIDKVDCILSGLPFAAFPDGLQHSLMQASLSVLKPGGKFATFAYWQGLLLPAGTRFRKIMNQYFESVSRTRTVWMNIPPAFVYRCTTSKK